MALAEFPIPQSAALAMCPPQANTTAWLVDTAAPRLKSTSTVVVHVPVPLGTLSAVMNALVNDEPFGPKSLNDPDGCAGPAKVPFAPPQLISLPAGLEPGEPAGGAVKFSAGTVVEPTGEAVFHCDAGISLAATRSEHGLLLLAWTMVDTPLMIVEDVPAVAASVASYDPR